MHCCLRNMMIVMQFCMMRLTPRASSYFVAALLQEFVCFPPELDHAQTLTLGAVLLQSSSFSQGVCQSDPPQQAGDKVPILSSFLIILIRFLGKETTT